MASISYQIDWNRIEKFLDWWNDKYKVSEMNGGNEFEIVFSSYAPSNINECLTSNGVLNSDVTVTQSIDCGLKWDTTSKTVRLANDITWTLNDTIVPLKAVFIRHKTNKTVLGYSINNVSFDVTNQVKLSKDSLLWSFHDESEV